MQAYQPFGDPRTREEWQLDTVRDAYAEGKLTDAEMEHQVERILRGQPLEHLHPLPAWRDPGVPDGRPPGTLMRRWMRRVAVR